MPRLSPCWSNCGSSRVNERRYGKQQQCHAGCYWSSKGRWGWWPGIQKGWLLHRWRLRALPTALLVLVGSGCYDKVPQTGWLINNRSVFLTVLEAAGLRSGCQQGRVLVRTLFCVADCQLPLCTPTWWQESERALCGPSHKGTNHLPEAPSPKSSQWGVGFLHANLRDTFSSLNPPYFYLLPLESKLHEGKDFVCIVFYVSPGLHSE